MPITKASGNAVSPAAKGDLVVGSATNDASVLSVGSASQVLTVDSATTTGLKWAAVNQPTSWTLRLQGQANNFNRIAYNGSNLYVAVGNAGILYTSPDGITWTSRTSGFGANAINSVHYASGLSLWIIVGAVGLISTSSDGITWTARTSNFNSETINDVYSVGTTVVVCGNGGGTGNTGGLAYSTNGTTWTRKSQSLTVGATYNAITHNGTNWLIVGTNSTNNALYASTPSGTWTAINMGGAAGLTTAFYDGTRTFVSRQTGDLYYTTSTTFGSVQGTSSNVGPGGDAFMAYVNYYNGRIYYATDISRASKTTWGIASLSTTPSANSAAKMTDESVPEYGPMFYQSTNAYWVGATGKLYAVSGAIYSSF